MVRIFAHVVAAVAMLAMALPPPFTVNTDAGDGGSPGSRQAVDGKKPYDPVSKLLPFPVLKTYQALFPGHQIWQLAQTGKGDQTVFELTIFHPDSTSVSGKQVGVAHINTLVNYKLILKATGEVIQEQAHPIAASAVPKAVKDAVAKWKPIPKKGEFVEWAAHQEEGAERLYSIAIILNAVEGYRATLKADGTFLKKSAD